MFTKAERNGNEWSVLWFQISVQAVQTVPNSQYSTPAVSLHVLHSSDQAETFVTEFAEEFTSNNAFARLSSHHDLEIILI